MQGTITGVMLPAVKAGTTIQVTVNMRTVDIKVHLAPNIGVRTLINPIPDPVIMYTRYPPSPNRFSPCARREVKCLTHSRTNKTSTTVRSFPNPIGSDDKIVNLSSRTLTKDERRLLELGLKFIQAPYKKIPGAKENLIVDIEVTFNKYIWPKSSYMTWAECDIMAKLKDHIKLEIQNVQVVPPKSNFTQRLKMALKSLKEDPNIIIAKADKGDFVVVMDSEHYIGLTAKHLADSHLERCVDDKILKDYMYMYE